MRKRAMTLSVRRCGGSNRLRLKFETEIAAAAPATPAPNENTIRGSLFWEGSFSISHSTRFRNLAKGTNERSIYSRLICLFVALFSFFDSISPSLLHFSSSPVCLPLGPSIVHAIYWGVLVFSVSEQDHLGQ
jgi:hypothetical protein